MELLFNLLMLQRTCSLVSYRNARPAVKDCNVKLFRESILIPIGIDAMSNVASAQWSVDDELREKFLALEGASERRNEPVVDPLSDVYNNADSFKKYCDNDSDKSSHLVVLVNGLWGQAKHFDTMKRALYDSLGDENYCIHASKSNQLFATYDGIDACGRRLADEIEEIVANSRKNLGKISFIGHSMGGLISRNAIAKLFDRESGTLCGLEPQHFITLATPHVGFDHRHESAGLPLTSWVSRYVPLGGETVGGLLDSLAPGIASAFLGKSGAEFFHRDDVDDHSIMYRMSFDHENEKELYVSSLRRFRTRTVYANISGDHLVGWANSSLRTQEEQSNLNKLLDETAIGVVREDPLEFAFSSEIVSGSDIFNSERNSHPEERHERIEIALENLRKLGWRRIDVCYHGSRIPFLSHQHIMVQRPLINSVGYSTVQHLSAQFARMEKFLVESNE